MEETSYDDLIHKFLRSDVFYTQAKLQCMSTTSFKVDKQYTIFPEAFRIYRYLLRQWNQFSTFGMLDTDSILGDLEASVFIRDYNRRMGIYGLEGVKIRGFRGQVIMQFKRNEELQRVLALLSYYSQFTGLGIKTALGMGGVKCEVIEYLSFRIGTLKLNIRIMLKALPCYIGRVFLCAVFSSIHVYANGWGNNS